MDVEVIRDVPPERADELVALYDTWEWWADRDETRVAAAIDGSDAVVGLEDDGLLVASARAITDGVYYAKIYDVIVDADRRGEGLGQRVVDVLLDHPALADVDHANLLCEPDLVPFYRRCGFSEPPTDLQPLVVEP